MAAKDVENNFRLTLIDRGNIHRFSPLMLAWSAEQIRNGLPMPAIGAVTEDNTLAVGAIAGYIKEKYFLLASVYVAEKFRRQGVGTFMLGALKELLPDTVEYVAVSYTVTEEEHETLGAFLEAGGFTAHHEGPASFRFSVREICGSKYFKGKDSSYGKFLKDMDSVVLAKAQKRLDDSVLAGSLSGLHLDEDVTVIHETDMQIDAFTAFEYTEGKGLNLIAAYNGTDNPKALILMLQQSVAAIEKKYPPETFVYLDAITEASQKLVPAIMENAKTISRTYYDTVGGKR